MIAFETNELRTLMPLLVNRMKTQATPVHTERWQGRRVKEDPAAQMMELRNVVFEVRLSKLDNVEVWKAAVEPNLPWADDHFEERVGGVPLNPGVEWANWPWAQSADRFRRERFNHNYMERYWPKYARTQADDDPWLEGERDIRRYPAYVGVAHWGIDDREYGDLQDLIELLAHEPDTRQAYLPIFYPEDTGKADGGRKPCTLGYHFMRRGDKLHLWYPMRSCDIAHHLRDDIYMTLRLGQFVLEACQKLNPDQWVDVYLASFAMHITSLHCFVNDHRRL